MLLFSSRGFISFGGLFCIEGSCNRSILITSFALDIYMETRYGTWNWKRYSWHILWFTGHCYGALYLMNNGARYNRKRHDT